MIYNLQFRLLWSAAISVSTFKIISVIEFYWGVHENIQPYMYDVIDWPLVRMLTILGTDATGLSKRLLGLYKWTKG